MTMSENRLVQLGGSGTRDNDNVAFIRSDQAEAARREEARLRKPEVTKTKTQILGEQYANAYHAELRAKDAERQARIKSGQIVINPDGSETHRMRGLQY
jgi:hypothetical protein